ncbi:MAG: metallopeptidase [Oscillospiraceae bacterium]|nr:metallopeptidase [Oscillospiraceae bacterium]
MHENHEKLDRIGRSILSSTRNEIYLNMRFLDIALSGLDYTMNLNTATVGTDGFSIQFNPRHLIELYQQDLVLLTRVYLHMLLHCLLRHPLNREGREEDRWNLACDIAVESILDSIDNRCLNLLQSNLREDTYADLKEEMSVITAEAVYRWLGQKQDFLQQLELIREFRRDDHKFWPDDDPENKDQQQEQQQSGEGDGNGNDRREELEEKWKHLSEKTQTNMETFFASYGDEAGDILQSLVIENRERYDYRQFLKRFVTMREEMRVDMDSFDYAYYTLGMELYGDIPLIEPLEYRESRKIKDFVIVIDTSDSCSDGVIQKFLEETRTVLSAQELFFEDANLHIIQADADIQMDTVIHSAKELEAFCQNFQVRGFGGTDFRPAFRYVNRLIDSGDLAGLKGMLYFTDGFGAYPERKPDYEVAFVFFEEDYIAPQVPAWAIKVVLGPEELPDVEV